MVESATPVGRPFFRGPFRCGESPEAALRPDRPAKRGQALVEFALLIPIMLVLVVGIAEFGRGWMTRNILVGAAREGARVASVATSKSEGQSQGQEAARQVLSSAGISVPPAVVNVTFPSLSFPAVRVTVTYAYPVILLNFIPGLGSSVTLQGKATMRTEQY